MIPRCMVVWLGSLLAYTSIVMGATPWEATTRLINWQQVDAQPSFTGGFDREQYSTLDGQGRFVLAVQKGKAIDSLDDAVANWQLVHQGKLVAQGQVSLASGMACVDFSLQALAAASGPGRYELKASAVATGQQIGEEISTFFVLHQETPPPQSGRIPIVIPKGVQENIPDGVPLSVGFPFPKGALLNPGHVRIVTAEGKEIPCDAEVRSRWSGGESSSIRWLGVDFASHAVAPWWPDRKTPALFLEYGPDVNAQAIQTEQAIELKELPEGLAVSTGPLRFVVKKQGFNLLDDVYLHGKRVLDASAQHGAYLIDHEGAVYRAANDRDVKITVEKHGRLRSVIRVEGWYVKDNSTGERQHWSLPTDKLCRFITRLEVYAGQAVVRVLHTNIITYDTFSVRLRDMGVALPVHEMSRVWFGVENDEPLSLPARPQGAYLLQHLPHRFDIRNLQGEELASGRHTAGWMSGQGKAGVMAISHRNTWQLFPKEFEARENEIRFHIWPAHGVTHPEIDVLDHAQINRMWFCHQGREMDLTFPWEYALRISKLYDLRPSSGGNTPIQMALRSVQQSGMGVGVTSDFLLAFAADMPQARTQAEHFQRNVQAMADPAWICSTGVFGPAHPYDPEQFPFMEEMIVKANKARWATLDATDVYGMWTYRCWPDRAHLGNGVWDLSRHKAASHHHDAYIPWQLYARSGDPDYYDQGYANLRFLSDVQVLHHNDPSYPKQHQQMVGAMTHAGSATPWSSDASLVGHQLCYVSLITGYYMTGDLRLREVVVEEWQKSLLEDRANPIYNTYFRPDYVFGSGRDTNNTLGELIDLYQLTWHPALVPMMNRLLPLALKTPVNWGIWKENVLAFHGSTELKEIIRRLADHHRSPVDHPLDALFAGQPPQRWNDNHAGRSDELSWCAIWGRGDEDDLHAYFAAGHGQGNFGSLVHWFKVSNDMASQIPGYVWVPVPDRTKILPRVMHALASRNRAGQVPWLKAVALLPMDVSASKKWTQVVVREDEDRDFDIHIAGRISNQGLAIQVIDPQGKLIASTLFPPSEKLAFHRLRIPADGQTGQYSIFVQASPTDALYAPLTVDMPEVYLASIYSQVNQGNSFFYTRAAGDVPISFSVTCHENRAIIYDATRTKIIMDWPMDLIIQHLGGQTRRPTITSHVKVDREGVFFTTYAGYTRLVSPDQPLAYSVSAERWFLPDAAKYNLEPAP